MCRRELSSLLVATLFVYWPSDLSILKQRLNLIKNLIDSLHERMSPPSSYVQTPTAWYPSRIDGLFKVIYHIFISIVIFLVHKVHKMFYKFIKYKFVLCFLHFL